MFLNRNIFMKIVAFITNPDWKIWVTGHELWEASFDFFTESSGNSRVFLCREPPLVLAPMFKIPQGLTHKGWTFQKIQLECDVIVPIHSEAVVIWMGCLDTAMLGLQLEMLFREAYGVWPWWRRHVTGGWLWELFWLFSLFLACSNLKLWAKISHILCLGVGDVSS